MNAWPEKNSALVLDNCMTHHAANLQHLFDIKGTFQLLFGLFLIVKYIQGLFSYFFLLTHQITIQLSLASMLVSEHSPDHHCLLTSYSSQGSNAEGSRLFG